MYHASQYPLQIQATHHQSDRNTPPSNESSLSSISPNTSSSSSTSSNRSSPVLYHQSTPSQIQHSLPPASSVYQATYQSAHYNYSHYQRQAYPQYYYGYDNSRMNPPPPPPPVLNAQINDSSYTSRNNSLNDSQPSNSSSSSNESKSKSFLSFSIERILAPNPVKPTNSYVPIPVQSHPVPHVLQPVNFLDDKKRK